MQLLKDRILTEGHILPGNIIKVDGFLNHQLDVSLLSEMGKEFKQRFGNSGVTKILTVEASGIALACMTAQEFGVPALFAKKAKSDNIEGGLYRSEIYSYTYKKHVTLILSSQWLTKDDKVLIVDDFLANGEALRGLLDIVKQAGAKLAGVGIGIEKGFQPGGKTLREAGVPLYSLAIIDSVDNGTIVFRQD